MRVFTWMYVPVTSQTQHVQTRHELLRGMTAPAPHPSRGHPTQPRPPPHLVCWVPGGAASLGCSLQTQAVAHGLRILWHSHRTPFLTFLSQRTHCVPISWGPPSPFPRASPILTAPSQALPAALPSWSWVWEQLLPPASAGRAVSSSTLGWDCVCTAAAAAAG